MPLVIAISNTIFFTIAEQAHRKVLSKASALVAEILEQKFVRQSSVLVY